jgi:cohesin complex subunit SCC1
VYSNFVDHHVTTREQITLQDPVEDTIYLGSQFGLDGEYPVHYFTKTNS